MTRLIWPSQLRVKTDSVVSEWILRIGSRTSSRRVPKWIRFGRLVSDSAESAESAKVVSWLDRISRVNSKSRPVWSFLSGSFESGLGLVLVWAGSETDPTRPSLWIVVRDVPRANVYSDFSLGLGCECVGDGLWAKKGNDFHLILFWDLPLRYFLVQVCKKIAQSNTQK